MRIAIDARCLNRDHLRGMGKYVWNVLAHANLTEDFAWSLYGDRPEFPTHVPPNLQREMEVFEVRGYRFRSWEQVGLPHRAARANADVLHCTSTTLPWWQPVPTVVTIHDTVPWQGEPNGDPHWYTHRLLPSCYRKAAAVITISENSRRDILALWPELEHKLHVIPHGMDAGYFQNGALPLPAGLVKAGVQTPYLLYMGGEIPRKRLDWAIRLFESLNDSQLRLVVCGVASDSRESVLSQVPPELRERICLAPFVAEAEMPALYRNAVAVLYPTLYEGFGFPAVEAQAVGTPVLFSRVGSLAELDGPAAVVLPTDDFEAWLSACGKLVMERRASLVPNENARQWARRFSWEESARRHIEVYELAASSRKTKTSRHESARLQHAGS